MKLSIPEQRETWLLDQLQKREKGKSFAFNATTHWLRALAIVCELSDPPEIYKKSTIQKIQRDKNMDADRCLRVFEDLFMSAQSISALQDIQKNCTSRSLSATAITTWYYACYNVAKAMLVAKMDNVVLDNHADVAKLWCTTFALNESIPSPFSLHLPSLDKSTKESKIASLRQQFGAVGRLSETPYNLSSSYGCLIAYLSGSEKFYFERKRSELLAKAQAPDFKTKEARLVRDKWRSNQVLGYMHLAFRLRGKANYRDAIFLSYDHASASDRTVSRLLADLTSTSSCFFRVGLALCKARLPKEAFTKFVADVGSNTVLDKSLFE